MTTHAELPWSCPTPTADGHGWGCGCGNRPAETWYGRAIADTRDISDYRDERDMTDAPRFFIRPTGGDFQQVTEEEWHAAGPGQPAGSCTAAAEQTEPNNSCGSGCHCGLGTWDDCATKPWGCANDQDHAAPDAASRSRTTPDNPAGGGDAADNPGAACSCGRTPDPGVCAERCAPGLPADGHCRCACDGSPPPQLATPLGSSEAGSNESSPAVGICPVATSRNAPDLRTLIVAALEECRTLIPEVQADAVLAVVDAALPDRAQAAIRAAVEQVQVRDRQLAAIAEYVRTSDDDGIRTRERVLRILGTAGGEPTP